LQMWFTGLQVGVADTHAAQPLRVGHTL
jgi:hypothetical protein